MSTEPDPKPAPAESSSDGETPPINGVEENAKNPVSAEENSPAGEPSDATEPLDEPLPDWEELTPELFEDECVRGDFMLRWAAILLAVLIGCCFVTESSVLVEVKTGQYILDNGGLPPRTDPFSIATEGQSWVNRHWLADMVIGLGEKLGGFSTLTILTAIKLGLSFWLLAQIGYRNVPTWWGSICSAVAVIAIFPAVQPGASSATVLGFAALLWLLFLWREQPESKILGTFPVVMVLWSNADARAWIGLLVLAVFMLTDVIMKTATTRQLKIGGIAILAAVLVHPWPGSPVMGFQEALANADQLQNGGLSGELFPRYAHGMMSNEFWNAPDAFPIAAVALLALAFVALFLNANRFDWSLTISWFAVNGLTFYFGELVPYAAILNCVVATLQGQDWYRHRGEPDYSIRTSSVFFARTGRALTVLCFFLLAYSVINGMFMGPQGRRIGLGLDPRLVNRIESTRTELLDGIFGDRVFNVRSDQGDMLIWLDVKPYIDGRNNLFVNSIENFADKHVEIRSSIFGTSTQADKDDEESSLDWNTEFQDLGIESIIVRLWGPSPAYTPFLTMLTTPTWPMTALGAAGAVFTHNDSENSEIQEHIASHLAANFVEQAYNFEEGSESGETVERFPSWPIPESNYDKWLVQDLQVTSNKVQLARHYLSIVTQLGQQLVIDTGMALSALAIRSAEQGLIETPDDPTAYRILLESQSILDNLEQQFLNANGLSGAIPIRSQMTLSSAFHATKASNNSPEDLQRLFIVLMSRQSLDTALEVADIYQDVVGHPITSAGNPEVDDLEQANQALDDLRARVAEVQVSINEARSEKSTLPELAGIALNGQCPGIAVSILEEDKTVIAGDPGLQMMYGTLLLNVGRTQEAWEQLESMRPSMDQYSKQEPGFVSQWRSATAVANRIANAPDEAADLLADDAELQSMQGLRATLLQPPLSAITETQLDVWAGLALRTHAAALVELPERWATLKLQEAVVRIDEGSLEQAKEVLELILESHPEFSYRPLVVLYLRLITGEDIEYEPPSQWIPIWDDMFAPDDDALDQPVDLEKLSKAKADTPSPEPAEKKDDQADSTASVKSATEESTDAQPPKKDE